MSLFGPSVHTVCRVIPGIKSCNKSIILLLLFCSSFTDCLTEIYKMIHSDSLLLSFFLFTLQAFYFNVFMISKVYPLSFIKSLSSFLVLHCKTARVYINLLTYNVHTCSTLTIVL